MGVAIVGDGFKWVSGGREGAEALFAFASNPLVGVLLGILATALVQSSSTVTSVIVGLVAGGVPVSIAIPMIMGANMGTTVTNTIVSLGNLRDGQAFGRSFQAATVHDFFNMFAILIFLPIEILFRPLERMAGALSQQLVGSGDASLSGFNPVGALTNPLSDRIMDTLVLVPGGLGGFAAIALGVGLIIFSVLYLGRLLRAAMTGRAKSLIDAAVGRSPVRGVASGTVVTVLVQSSSTTTSLVVPLAGAGVISLRQVFPFTMGANLGTCITALLAATAVTGGYQVFALQIALVHLIFNTVAVLLFLTVPWLKSLPILAAEALGRRSAGNRAWALAYVASVFFLIPAGVFAREYFLA